MSTSCAVDPQTDTELMMLLQQGLMEPLELLMSRHRIGLRSFVARIVHDEAAAEEIVQDAFMRVYTSRARYEPRAKVSSWIYTIATRLALNWLRDNRLRRESREIRLEAKEDLNRPFQVPDPKPGPADQVMEFERYAGLQSLVRNALSILPERQRLAIVLQTWHEMPYDEIATSLGCSPQSVKSLLFRAHSSLRRQLSNHVQPRRCRAHARAVAA